MKNTPVKIFTLVLIAGIVGIVAVLVLLVDIVNIADCYRVIADEYFENTKDATEIRMLLQKHQVLVSNHVATEDEQQYKAYEQEAEKTATELKATFASFGKRMTVGERESIYHSAYTEFLSYLQNAANAMTFSRAGNKGTARYYVASIMEGHIKMVDSAFDRLDKFTDKEIAHAKEQMNLYIHISIISACASIGIITLVIVFTSILCFRITSGLNSYKNDLERGIARQTEMIMAQNEQKEQLLSQTVFALANAVDAKDNYTSGHSRRVAAYARLIAERMGKTREEQEEIYRAGLLHDIGKIRIPEGIINKPSKLTADEYAMIKLHPITGYHILKDVSSEKIFADGTRFHHERYDGGGYPLGLTGEQIPEVARIICVADAYDAMASRRSYRDTMPQRAVRREIETNKGTQFDPAIADIMLGLIDEDKGYTMKEPKPAQRRILAVDDREENLKLIADALADVANYSLVPASSGEAAIEALQEAPCDVALVDMKMHDMNGFEVAKKIREFSNIHIVLMTKDRINLDFDELKKYNITDFVSKPIIPSALKEVLHAVLSE